MTVKELIAELEKVDKSSRVMVSDWRIETTDHRTCHMSVSFPTVVAVIFNQIFLTTDLKIGKSV